MFAAKVAHKSCKALLYEEVALKMLMKLRLSLNFISIFRARFLYETSLRQLFSSYFKYVEKLQNDVCTKNSYVKMLMKLTLGVTETPASRTPNALKLPEAACGAPDLRQQTALSMTVISQGTYFVS